MKAVKVKQTRNHHHLLEEMIEACEYYRDNRGGGKVTQVMVAEKYGVSLKTFSNWWRDYNVEKKGEAKENMASKGNLAMDVAFPQDRLVIPIQDAANNMLIEANDVIKYAVCGAIKIIYPVDNNGLLRSTGDFSGEVISKSIIQMRKIEGKWTNKADYLVLDTVDCDALLRQGSVRKVGFAYGVFFVDNGSYIELKPYSPPKHKFLPSASRQKKSEFVFLVNEDVLEKFSIDPDRDFKRIDVYIDRVFVIRSELIRLWGREKNNVATRQSIEDDFVRSANSSSYLVEVDEAAFEMYGGDNPIRIAYFQSRDRVSLYLHEVYGMPRFYADQFSEIITPRDRSEYLYEGYRTKGLQDLIDAWSYIFLNKGLEKISKEWIEAEYQKWLGSRGLPFPAASRLEFVCKAIAPDKSRFGLRRNNRNA